VDFKTVWAVFFSPTGTTRKIVTAIADSIANRLTAGYDEFDFTLPEARKTGRDFPRDDLIVFGVPVYAGRVPNVLLKYLDTLHEILPAARCRRQPDGPAQGEAVDW